MLTAIAAHHTTPTGTTIEIHDRGYDTDGFYHPRAVMISRDQDGTTTDTLYAESTARWEDDPLAGYYRAAVRLRP
jgi:hypothetical protein